LLGIAVAAAFIVIANLQVGGRSSIVATIFSSRPMVLMGTFSYSLYLIHYPIISIAMTAIQPLPPAQKLAVTFLVLVPAVIAIAYLFSKVFEAPFMSSGRRLAEERALSGKPNLTHSTSNKPGAA
jgi:peptidoglycan/LPS O-acetylase OafA/YrhL